MLLNEFIYFNGENPDMDDDKTYDPFHDSSVITSKDLRKTRLTLRMIHDLRKAGEAREQEKMEETQLLQAMYKNPTPEEAAAQGAA